MGLLEVEFTKQRFAEAEELCERSRRLLDDLLTTFPQNAVWQRQRAMLSEWESRLAAQRQDSTAALSHACKACDEFCPGRT